METPMKESITTSNIVDLAPICQDGQLHPYLQTLRHAGVRPDMILRTAEDLGADHEELLLVARILIGSTHPMAGIALALGSIRKWKWVRDRALREGFPLVASLVGVNYPRGHVPPLEPLDQLFGDIDRDHFRARALNRLGYPRHLIPAQTHAGKVRDPVTMQREIRTWLDGGNGLISPSMELKGIFSHAPKWSPFMAPDLRIQDCHIPPTLHRIQADWPYRGANLRLIRVSGLSELEDDSSSPTIVAVACPDLERIEPAPRNIVAVDCPRLSEIHLLLDSGLLHLERCPQIVDLRTELSYIWVAGNEVMDLLTTCNSLVLKDCPQLRLLPRWLRVKKDMLLDHVGPIEVWPVQFHVEGDLCIRNCTCIEELPPMEIGGSLRVEGQSSLRRLSPGSTIGGHLDLRPCSHLESIPKNIRVGGNLYLPSHLCKAPQAPRVITFEAPDPLFEMPYDRYPDLRTLLMSLQFCELCPPDQRFEIQQAAEVILDQTRRELRENPRLESEILWIASEVWQDLTEEQWERNHYWGSASESDVDLPVSWFRSLLDV